VPGASLLPFLLSVGMAVFFFGLLGQSIWLTAVTFGPSSGRPAVSTNRVGKNSVRLAGLR
jgi:hypothetical protein